MILRAVTFDFARYITVLFGAGLLDPCAATGMLMETSLSSGAIQNVGVKCGAIQSDFRRCL